MALARGDPGGSLEDAGDDELDYRAFVGIRDDTLDEAVAAFGEIPVFPVLVTSGNATLDLRTAIVDALAPGSCERPGCRRPRRRRAENLHKPPHKSKLWGRARRSHETDPTPLIHAEPLSDTFVNTNEAQNPGAQTCSRA